jgi:hypothetical protein
MAAIGCMNPPPDRPVWLSAPSFARFLTLNVIFWI